MATVPLSGTNIRLLSGVPFSNDYKHTRWFDTLALQNVYFDGKTAVHTMLEANFQRIEGYHFIRVNKSIDELWGTNYVQFQNLQYNGKRFYGFVAKLEYVQKNLTNVHFQIDVLQTWRFEMNFKPSFVIREHRPLWNADGTPIINTIDEGLNYGSEYEVMDVTKYKPFTDVYFLVIVTKETMHLDGSQEVMPNLNGIPQSLCYYVHPFKRDADINNRPGAVIGGENIAISPILEVLKAVAKSTDAVNNVVSMYITDHIGGSITYDETWNELTFPSTNFMNAIINDGDIGFSTIFAKSLPSYSEKTVTFKDKYSSYKTVKESKLLMYPYTVLVMDDLKGNRQVLKNEHINGKDITISIAGSLGTSNKVSYNVYDYLVKPALGISDLFPATLEHAVISNNSNDIPIITDMLSAYLQGNRNSLENQKDSIVFNGAMGVVGSTIGGVSAGMQAGNAGVGVASAGVGVVQGAGNTVLQLQGLEAKKQDINNTPPSLVKMGGNTNFDYGNGLSGIFLIKKQIKQEYINLLEDFFGMFGYKTNEVKYPNFHTRQYWNYVQTSSCIITGNFNNEDLNELKAVFDNGITLWHTDDVGNYALENGVIA